MILRIMDLSAREILDSRGNPTVETEVKAVIEESFMSGQVITGIASVPSGASTGRFEAMELRDNENRYLGAGVRKAVDNVNVILKKILVGKNCLNQNELDGLLIVADGTENKSRIGANATLSVSLACARCAANALQIPLYRYLGGAVACRMPVPMMNILNGGKHADNTIDFQEFMIMPVSAGCFSEGLRQCSEIYHCLKKICMEKGLSTSVGDEGGFAPNLSKTEQAIELILDAVVKAGLKADEDIQIALDVAASELYDSETNLYIFEGESIMKGSAVCRDSYEMIAYYEELISQYPIMSIEDGLSEDDWEGWKSLTERVGSKIQLVGDDLFVTNPKRLEAGIQIGAANSILTKVNQIGTLTEAVNAVRIAQMHGMNAIISHRSGETEDSFIADLSVALGTGQIKTGAPARGERTSKYNRLLKIEQELDQSAIYKNPFRIH